MIDLARQLVLGHDRVRLLFGLGILGLDLGFRVLRKRVRQLDDRCFGTVYLLREFLHYLLVVIRRFLPGLAEVF